MSERNLKLQVVFAAIDRMSGSVKNIAKSSRQMSGELTEARQKLKALQAASGDVASFRRLKGGLRDAERAIEAKQRAVDALAREMRDAERPTARLTQQFNKAKREASSTRDAFARQQSELQKLRSRLRDAGYSTDDLVASEKRLRAEIDRTNGQMSQRKKALGDMRRMQAKGAGIRNAGVAATAAVTVPAGFFVREAVAAASAKKELISAFNVTFDKNAADMQAWADSTGNALGRAKSSMMEGANAFGLFFNSAFEPKKSADMSKQFAVLAQDLESFHNLEAGQGLEKLRAGLSGESEPLKALGIMLNETQVKAKAAAMGFKAVNGQLTEEQKIAARAAIILEKTANAQGDVARTSESTANRVRALTEAKKELSENVGDRLTPILDFLAEKLTWLMEGFNKLSPQAQTVIIVIGLLIAVVGPLLMVIGTLVASVGFIAAGFAAVTAPVWGLIGVILLVVAALALGAVAIAMHWDTITAAFWAAVDWVKNALNNIWAALTGAFDLWVSLQIRALEIGKNIIQGLVDGIMAAPGAVWNALKSVVMAGLDGVRGLLRINSPSRVFMDLGRSTTEGMTLGIDKSGRRPIAAMSRLATGIVSAGSIAVASPSAAAPVMAGAPAGAPGGGTSGGLTVTINIQQLPGQDATALAEEVRRQLERMAGQAARSSYSDA